MSTDGSGGTPRYRVEFSEAAAKQLRKLDRAAQEQIAAKIRAIEVDPRGRGCEKLTGEPNAYRIRSGDYRIVYEVFDDRVMVRVVGVDHRRNIYQFIKRKRRGPSRR